MLHVAMLSKWHVHAKDYAKAIAQSDRAKIVAVWDEEPARGREWAKELGVEFIEDLDTLLAREDIHAVVCDTPTTMHHEVLRKAAKAKKHIYTEKALDTTQKGAKEIGKEIENAGITFTISFPLLSSPLIKLAKEMIDAGDFGTISYARFRRAHDGLSTNWLPAYWYNEEQAGGGALMDLGCHGYYIGHHLFGSPKRLTCLMSNLLDSPVDDSAVTAIEFEQGTVYQAETGFITVGFGDVLEIHGTDAILLSAEGRLVVRKKGSKEFETPVLPEASPTPMETFITACLNGTGTPEPYGLEAAYMLSELLEQSYKADKENKTITW